MSYKGNNYNPNYRGKTQGNTRRPNRGGGRGNGNNPPVVVTVGPLMIAIGRKTGNGGFLAFGAIQAKYVAWAVFAVAVFVAKG